MIFFRSQTGLAHNSLWKHSHPNMRKSIPRHFYQGNTLHCQGRRFSASVPKEMGNSMNKSLKIFLSILVGGIFSSAYYAYATEKSDYHDQNAAFIQMVDENIIDTMTHSKEIPGFDAVTFNNLKEVTLETWSEVVKNGIIECTGPDEKYRAHFVLLQGVAEHVLSNLLATQDITSLQAIILTPMPATPLCSKGEISKKLVHTAIELDKSRLSTVKARVVIVRDFLDRGGYIYSVYPKQGFAKRTDEQQAIYKQELMNYPHHLVDRPLNCHLIPNELIGATYIFTDKNQNKYVLSINITQANDPKDQGKYRLLFGPYEMHVIRQQVLATLNFIEKNGGEILETPSAQMIQFLFPSI